MIKRTARVTQIPQILPVAFAAGLTPLFVGPPGIGKTEVVRSVLPQLAQLLGCRADELGFAEEHLASLSEVDLRGYLIPQGNDSVFTRPAFFRAFDGKAGGILFLDEFMQAPDEIQKAVAPLLSRDRRIGEHVLPPNVFVVLAGNGTDHGSGANALLQHVVNRLMIISVTPPTPDELVEHYADIGMPAEVMALVKLKPDAVFGELPDTDNTPYASPRSVAALGRMVNAWPGGATALVANALGMAMVEGVVGQATAVEFGGMVQLMGRVPPLEQILADPHGVVVPDAPDLRYAMLLMVATRAPVESAEQAATFLACRFNPNFAMVGFTSLLRRDDRFMDTNAFGAWAAKNGDVVAKLLRFRKDGA